MTKPNRGVSAEPVTSPRAVWYVTVRFPIGSGEEFLGPESTALASKVPLTIVPLRPPARATESDGTLCEPLLGRRALMAALRLSARRPADVWRAMRRAVFGTSFRNILRNLAVLPKALWMASQVPPGTHLHATWASTPATACMIAAELSGATWSFTAHRHDIDTDNNLRAKVAAARFARCISESGRVALLRFVDERDRARVQVVHLGVEVPDTWSAERISDGVTTVLVPAALILRKNHQTMLRAAATPQSARTRLLLVGDGPERPAIEELAQKLGVSDRVEFLGGLPHAELLALYERPDIDLVALASESEGIPVVLMEAMARGKPVVSTDVGGVRELVDEEAGALVQRIHDPQDHAAAWTDVGSRDPAVTGQRARRIVLDRFDVHATTSTLLRLIADEPVDGVSR